MLQISHTPVCWSAHCHVWHPSQDFYPCYGGMHPTQGQLPGRHQEGYCLPLHDDTYMNAVSSQLTLFQTPQQPHCRILPDLTPLCHSLHLPSLHNQCSLHQLHPQHLQLQSHRPQLLPPCHLSQRSPLCLWLQHPVYPLCIPGDQAVLA